MLDLLQVVQAWDTFVREVLPPSGLWFAPLAPTTGELDPALIDGGPSRPTKVRRDLKRWLERLGLPYHSPHKFRHGHAVYSLKQASDVGDLKATSLNLMHANLSITDGIYAILSDADVRARIDALGQGKKLTDIDLAAALRALADELDQHSA